MKKLLFIILLLTAACQKDEPEAHHLEYCCDCMEYYSGWFGAPAFCGTSEEVDDYMYRLYSRQINGSIDYKCTKYINDK